MNAPALHVSVAAFFKRRLPPLRGWGREKQLRTIGWYAAHGCLIVVREGGRIMGAALVRVVESEPDEAHYYTHQPETGTLLLVDQLACRDQRGGIGAILYLARREWPQLTHLQGERWRRHGRRCHVAITNHLMRLLGA